MATSKESDLLSFACSASFNRVARLLFLSSSKVRTLGVEFSELLLAFWKLDFRAEFSVLLALDCRDNIEALEFVLLAGSFRCLIAGVVSPEFILFLTTYCNSQKIIMIKAKLDICILFL
jgi:hypothetical protein